MPRTLGLIAATGLAAGVVSLSLAYVTGGSELDRLLDRSRFTLQSCGDGNGTGGASERRLAWSGGDAIEIALPASVRLRPGAGEEMIVRGSADTIVHVQLRGGRLSLDCRWLAASRSIDIELPKPAFRAVRISGSARVMLEGLSQPELALAISGSGSARAQGAVDQLTATISGSGDARLADVALKRLTAKNIGQRQYRSSAERRGRHQHLRLGQREAAQPPGAPEEPYRGLRPDQPTTGKRRTG